MEQFGHLAVYLQYALAGILRVCERLNHGLCMFHIMRARREDAVGRVELRWMDQSLAVEAEVTPLLTLVDQALLVLDVIVDAINRDDVVGAGRSHAHA